MWPECILTATCLINRLPSSVLSGKSPYEMIYKKFHSLAHLRVFGCLCFATLVNSSDKFGSRSEKDVKFFENIFPFKDPDKIKDATENVFQDSASSCSFESGGISVTADFPINSGNDTDSSDNIFSTQNEDVTTLEENVFSEGNMDQNPNTVSQDNKNLRRSSRQNVFPKSYNDFVVDSNVKYGIKKKSIGSKWIHKIKFQSSGEIDRFKARLVAQGFSQKKSIDYEEKFSPVVKMLIVKCLLNVVVSQFWPIFQLGVNDAFLYGDLDEDVYMKPPEGCFPSGCFFALLVYVDDIIITGNNVAEIEKFKVFLKSKFMIKDLEKLKYFLRIEVVDTEKGIYLNQRKYVLDLLSEYGMLACKPVDTPLLSKLVISNEATESDHVLEKITDYQKLM
ncbi:ribonuclease H-like domain-containing protein, partial [Tanacetum coccineum]